MLGDNAVKKRKPLKGRRRGGKKKTELNRSKGQQEKQGFLASWAKAARKEAVPTKTDMTARIVEQDL